MIFAGVASCASESEDSSSSSEASSVIVDYGTAISDSDTNSRTGTLTITKGEAPSGYAGVGYSSSYGSSSYTETVTVTSKSDLVKYAKKGGCFIIVDGMIDMSEGYLPSTGGGTTSSLDSFVKEKTSAKYATYAAWQSAYAAACSTSTEDSSKSTSGSSLNEDLWTLNNAYKKIIQLDVAKNTAIVGKDAQSGIKGGTISISGVSNVVLRNLKIQDAYDPFPHHEAGDGYNAQFDCVTIQGSSTSYIWIDHCTFEDTMTLGHVMTGGTGGKEEKWQTYDGLLDIKGQGKYITVSYCKFKNHDKTSLIGSGDSEGSSSTRLITYHHNYFYNCGQRLPMVRNTTLHLYNNYYSASSPAYEQQYAVGVRKGSIIYAENNYFGSGIKYSFNNSDGELYSSGNTDKSSKGCNSTVTGADLFSSKVNAYSYTADSDISSVPSLAGTGAVIIN